jgi:hypothetical protein
LKIAGGATSPTPALPRAKPAEPTAGARPGALRLQTRGWLRLQVWHTFCFFESKLGDAPALRCARLVSQTARYRGRRGAWQAGAAAPTPPLSAAPGLSFPRRLACLADGSLPRATKRWPSCARTGKLAVSSFSRRCTSEMAVEVSLAAIVRIKLNYQNFLPRIFFPNNDKPSNVCPYLNSKSGKKSCGKDNRTLRPYSAHHRRLEFTEGHRSYRRSQV